MWRSKNWFWTFQLLSVKTSLELGICFLLFWVQLVWNLFLVFSFINSILCIDQDLGKSNFNTSQVKEFVDGERRGFREDHRVFLRSTSSWFFTSKRNSGWFPTLSGSGLYRASPPYCGRPKECNLVEFINTKIFPHILCLDFWDFEFYVFGFDL